MHMRIFPDGLSHTFHLSRQIWDVALQSTVAPPLSQAQYAALPAVSPQLHRNGRQATLVVSMCAECFLRRQSWCGIAQASRDPLGSMIAVPLPGSILYALLGTSRNSNLLSWPEYLPPVLPLPCQVLEGRSDLFQPPVAAGISEHSENYYLRSMREFEPGDVSIYLCHTAEGCWCRWHTSRQ